MGVSNELLDGGADGDWPKPVNAMAAAILKSLLSASGGLVPGDDRLRKVRLCAASQDGSLV
jgi:hypothetical protein